KPAAGQTRRPSASKRYVPEKRFTEALPDTLPDGSKAMVMAESGTRALGLPPATQLTRCHSEVCPAAAGAGVGAGEGAAVPGDSAAAVSACGAGSLAATSGASGATAGVASSYSPAANAARSASRASVTSSWHSRTYSAEFSP